jgi:1-acyl-sn-glycerol-3-phosphate acyltransferase
MNAAMILLWLFVCLLQRGEARVTRLAVPWTQWWLRRCTQLMGVRVTVSGPLPPPGSLIAPNHMGYADIFAVGAKVPCFFVAKSDVLSWPLIGYVFRLSRQIAVSRTRSTKDLKHTMQTLSERLEAGYSVCVFLEGTSSGGETILPFHGALLQPAIDAGAPIVPAAIRWTADDPRIEVREDVAYWKDHIFMSHMFRLLGLRGVRAEIRFGEPLDAQTLSRNDAADALHRAVSNLHADLHAADA